jgi:hypothetical protein
MYRGELLARVIKDEEARNTSTTAQEETRIRGTEGGGFEVITCLND